MSALEAKILDTIVQETQDERPPTAGRLVKLLEDFSKPGIYKALDRLRKRGFIKDSYPQGPLIPRRTPDGKPCKTGIYVIMDGLEEVNEE